MKLYHYSLYDYKGRPVVSVCLIDDQSRVTRQHIYTRGIAICSPMDFGNLRKKLGWKIARSRALYAHMNRDIFGEVRREHVLAQLREAEAIMLIPFRCKACYNVKLSEYEKKLVGQEEIPIAPVTQGICLLPMEALTHTEGISAHG